MNVLSDIRYVIVIAVVFLTLKSQLSARIKMIINLPGVFLHELLHYIVAFIFDGKPTQFAVFPEQTQNGDWVGGYVNFTNLRWFNAMPIGLAPLIGLLPAWNLHHVWYGALWLYDWRIAQDILYVIVELYLIEASIPSLTDLKIAVSKPAGIAVYGVAAAGIYRLFLLWTGLNLR